jgi:hypothetical protein
LGLREGATENAAACKALLADLIERGLNPGRAILMVIDGAKALPGNLERVLSSTNLIENLFSRVREDRAAGQTLARRGDDSQMDRGPDARAERYFRKIAGHRALPRLVVALHAHDAAIDRPRQLESGTRAA